MTFTYLFLLFSVVLFLSIKTQKLMVASIIVSSSVAFYYGVVNVTGLSSVLGFLGIVWFYFNRPQWPLIVRIPLFIMVIAYSIAFLCHWLQGFNNLLYLKQVHLSPGSCPFSMYLNFDKTMMGLILYGMSFLYKEEKGLNYPAFKKILQMLFLCILVLMPASLLSGYVNFDYKLSEHLLMWSITNLFFVCFAEEVFFRGFIQNTLMRLSPHYIPFWIPLLITSLLFGAAHFQGGMMYMILSAVAGLFYGYTYYKTGRILCSMLVHFGLNLVHFIFFSYPASIQVCQ
jgi:membrane protease YdiL (CAAX protease family)